MQAISTESIFRFDVRDRTHIRRICGGAIRCAAEHEPEGFQQVVDINLNDIMRCCAAARRLLQKSSGAIVNIASMLSFFGGGVAGDQGTRDRIRP
jgi:NAD(P)-dependent dehydrogenase (short-subunit alcohol dehydrogenase family)